MRSLKKYFGLLLILFLNITFCSGQQRPQYTQYIFNNFLLNPALSGMENYIDIKMGHRNQWAGLEGAPKTGFVTANWALGDQYLWANALSFEENGNNPMSRSYTQNYTASPSHHGVGFTAVMDKAAQISTFAFNLTYAYHLRLSNRLNLSVGAAAGITNIGLDVNALQFETPQDPALRNTISNQTKPDFSMGLWIYGARFFSGISIQQIIPQKLNFTSSEGYNTGKQVPHLFVTGGYKLDATEDISVTPSLMLKYVQDLPASVDINVKAAFKDKFWIGASGRKDDSYTAMVGFNVGHLINLTYAYDFTTSQLNQVSNGSHEIVLGVLLNNVYKVLCPQKMW
ncbi:PorP/SprF family type IX secretion system membrane protein [Pedobacter sp. NJ-S-72]